MATLDINAMTLNDIDVNTLTNDQNNGVFDKLMSAVNKNIEQQYTLGNIDSTDYANVYLGSIQAVLAQSVQFSLQEQITEAQVSAILKDNELKTAQLESIAKDNLLKDNQLLIGELELSIKTYEYENLLPEQLNKLKEETTSIQKDSAIKDDQLLSMSLDRSIKTYEYENLLPEQLNKLVEEITNIQKDAALKDDQLLSMAVERALKSYELDTLLPEQLAKLQGEISMLATQESELTADGTKKRMLMDEEIETANKQQVLADAQLGLVKVDTIIKDKEAARLGLDNVMKNSEQSKSSDPTFVYQPKYATSGA